MSLTAAVLNAAAPPLSARTTSAPSSDAASLPHAAKRTRQRGAPVSSRVMTHILLERGEAGLAEAGRAARAPARAAVGGAAGVEQHRHRTCDICTACRASLEGRPGPSRGETRMHALTRGSDAMARVIHLSIYHSRRQVCVKLCRQQLRLLRQAQHRVRGDARQLALQAGELRGRCVRGPGGAFGVGAAWARPAGSQGHCLGLAGRRRPPVVFALGGTRHPSHPTVLAR